MLEIPFDGKSICIHMKETLSNKFQLRTKSSYELLKSYIDKWLLENQSLQETSYQEYLKRRVDCLGNKEEPTIIKPNSDFVSEFPTSLPLNACTEKRNQNQEIEPDNNCFEQSPTNSMFDFVKKFPNETKTPQAIQGLKGNLVFCLNYKQVRVIRLPLLQNL